MTEIYNYLFPNPLCLIARGLIASIQLLQPFLLPLVILKSVTSVPVILLEFIYSCTKYQCFHIFLGIKLKIIYLLHSFLPIHFMLLIPFSIILVVTSYIHEFRGLPFLPKNMQLMIAV